MEVRSLLLFFTYILTFLRNSTAGDTLIPSQVIIDGETLISSRGSFELGFFSPGSSKNRYLGIWYRKFSNGTVVWVANRETPIIDSSGILSITNEGVLILINGTKELVWSSNSSKESQNPVVQLLENGNLVVRENNHDNFIWQSFDYPCDTLLPGMKLGWNLKTGLNRYLSSWKSSDDLSYGEFRNGLDPHGFPQLFVWKVSVIQYRTGPWNGIRFSGMDSQKPIRITDIFFVINQEEIYFMYTVVNNSVITKVMLTQSGLIEQFMWIEQTQNWVLFQTAQKDQCDNYALCGPNASCNINYQNFCVCLKKFRPKSQDAWNKMDWSGGCVRITPLDCRNGDIFLKYGGLKLPDTTRSWVYQSMNLDECKLQCSKNCSCVAYANSDITGGSVCLLWFDDLIDIREFSNGESGQDLYIRMAASEQGHSEFRNNNNKNKRIAFIITGVVLIMVIILVGIVCFLRKNKSKQTEIEGKINHREEMDLPFFEFDEIVKATNNFSINNKLGEGGFGPVYKGILAEGQEIAVKRLSKQSGQGLSEFRNEVILIAKLQHRNLVKLLGCCIQGEEKMLIYEYMPNKSLDYFIFDRTRRTLLDWKTCYQIINGIARGLLYLHQDSRLRIIHRDLKTSNILLDNDMNPKISDFGLARAFGQDQIEANTGRVVGTYGYMSPEYAIDGLFSIKSDVFSFGVLILEIMSGKKNRGFNHIDHHLNLLGHAWRLWKEGTHLELIDALMDRSVVISEVVRCIHVGLLCVQQYPEDRPSMSSVVLMLTSETTILPQPKQPGFFTERNPDENEAISSNKVELCSVNEITITMVEAR